MRSFSIYLQGILCFMLLYITSLLFSAIPIHQSLSIRLVPETNMVYGETRITVSGSGDLEIKGSGTFLDLVDGETITLHWEEAFSDDIAAGEKVGQIHNFSVDAHVSEDGVFLSDWAPWYPKPVDQDGNPFLRTMDLEVAPIEGWTFVGSGNPIDGKWVTPRPVDGMALVGNKHVVQSKVVQTPQGKVKVAVHLLPDHADKSDYYLNAADDYLQLYTPLLGKYPYDQFTILENFFSSGFAYPGFTVLGPRVVGMAPKSLAPGYLDHELIHNWWGNGVYVDAKLGNWCEALTSYTANYGRRALEDGAAAARKYRRGLLNKVSLDQTLDNGPLSNFGSADPADGPVDRFVGYDKGAFVFMMLEDVLNEGSIDDASKSRIWPTLARFAKNNMGKAASWNDIQTAAEQEFPDRKVGWLDPFFKYWVLEHNVPKTTAEIEVVEPQRVDISRGEGWIDIDPDYRYYRIFPKGQISPTIAGTLSGATVEVAATENILQDPGQWLAEVDEGSNLLLIGDDPIQKHAVLISSCNDQIIFTDHGFIVDGETYEGEDLAVLHTMNHPTHEGEFITIFHSVGETGWERLRFIWYYTKDTTVIWNANETLVRRVFEPSTKLQN